MADVEQVLLSVCILRQRGEKVDGLGTTQGGLVPVVHWLGLLIANFEQVSL